MNIRDFEYLVALDEQKNFIKASEKCFVSQPALSQQVKKIEDQLGFCIFEREIPKPFKTLAATPSSSSKSPNNRCSVPI